MASQVPYSPAPEVSPQLAPTPFGRNTPPPGAFGGLTAAATEHLGNAISQTGNELFERANAMQLMSQQAAADEAASHFQMRSAAKLNELLSRQGKDAADALIPTLNDIEQTRQAGREGLSPYGQMQYDRDTRRMQGQLMFDAGRHAAAEQKTYFSGGIKAKVDTVNQVALGRPMDDNAYQQGLDDIDKSAQNLADLHGWNSDETKNWATQHKSTLSLNRLTGIARTGDPFTAGRMAEHDIAKNILIGQDITTANERIYKQQNVGGSDLIANRVLSGEGSAAGGGLIPLNVAAITVGQYLSKDNYDMIGRAHDGSGQALGRYGVPAEKLSMWLKEADMPDMSAGDFLKSHSAQDQLFQTRFGQLQDDAGNFNDALLKWTGAKVTPVGPGTAEQRQTFNLLKSLGWSNDHAHAAVATLSGESGSHLSTEANQKAGGRGWGDRFETTTPDNGIANWDQARSLALEQWASSRGMNPDKRETQVHFFDYEARQMGFNPAETGDPRALTVKLTGDSASGQGYEKPLVNNGSDRWARYSGQRYAQDPVIQQTNGLLAKNTPLEDLLEQGKRTASDLAPNNHLLPIYVANRITSMYLKQEAQQKAEEYQNRNIVDAAMLPDQQGRVPVSLEELLQRPEVAQAYDHSRPEQQIKWQKVLNNNILEGGVVGTPESLREFARLKTIAVLGGTQRERQELLDTDIPGLNIPMKDRQELFKLQQQVYKQEEASPQVAKALKVLGPVFGNALPVKADTDNYNSFHSQLHDALQQHNRDFAKPINDDDIKEIGRRLLLAQPPPWSQRHLPEWLLPEPTRQYQLPLDPKLVDIARDDPRWAKVGIDPTDDMIRTWIVQEQFRQLYEKKQAAR